ncbi:hybrid sensor histidine kinase/response regulator [Piscinibacter sp.]|uniref:hybrid sensor histidine kinase/response regulator n=1 Tax=Piscinibacter sp. TaxID=1903157 RepID=UPI002CFB90DC|nr:response regulator [Albitalea sp.]HUG26197.1 response regulator [Albitalea sp.]
MHPDAALEPPPTTILAVDDEPANLSLLIKWLEDRGHKVVVALDGEEALSRAEFAQPDLILLDVQMPRLNGFDTCRRLKADPRLRDVPVIFMTALTNIRDKLAGFDAGAVDFITKPLDAAEVIARIETHIALYTLRRQLVLRNTRLSEEIAVREQAQAALERSNKELEQLAIERAVRVRAEGESAGLRRLLEERDQMLFEREEMLRLLAHEVRQPLNNASAALEMASSAITASGSPGPRDPRKPLVRAQQVLDHVIGTLNNALAAATMLTSGNTEAIRDTELDTFIQLVVHDLTPDDRERLVIESTPGNRTVQLQPVLMRLALCNLLVNALAYSPRASVVRLVVAETEEPLALTFEVIDEGEGIPNELRPTLFDKGTRGRNASNKAGAGLGMYIVRRVIDLHDGRIDILGNKPKGSIIRVSIPQGVGV